MFNNCDALLNAGCYKWKHDSVLREIVDSIPRRNWKVVADLPGFTYALPFQADSAWRPDIVLTSDDHHVHMIELTVPFEQNMTAAHDRKMTKYHKLVENARDAGFIPTLWCVEIGSRGLPGKNWFDWVKATKLPQSVTKNCCKIALRCSQVIWGQKGGHWPTPPLLLLCGEESL